MIDLERDQLRKTYLLSRASFLFLSAALVLASLSSLVLLVGRLIGDRRLFMMILNSPLHRWAEAPIVWGSLIGVTLLWGRWDHKSWQRRTGLLLVMSLVDVAVWFLDQGDVQLFGEGPWLRAHLGQALGWAEFALLASLSGDYLVHLGLNQAEESGRSTRSLAATGAVVWLLFFCEQTNWSGGWPLRPRNFPTIEGWLLSLGWNLIWTVTLIQVTALSIACVRQTSRVLSEMDREEHDHELLRLPSESRKQGELLSLQHQGKGKDAWM